MNSVARGAVAAMAMSGVRSLTTSLGLVRLTPPEEIGARGGAPLLARVPPERRGAVLELAHWGYGALGGALFAALPVRGRAAGVAYGLALWAFFEAALAPTLGAPERERPTSELLALAADHVFYGLVVGSRGE